MVLLYAEDVHAQVHITQNILQMLRRQRKPTHRQAGCATTSLLDSRTVTPLMQNNAMILMSYLTE